VDDCRWCNHPAKRWRWRVGDDGRSLRWLGLNGTGWKPTFAYALSNQPQHKFKVVSPQPLTGGNHIIRVKFEYDGGGVGKGATSTLLVDEKEVAKGRIPQTIPVRFSLDETFDVGQDTGTPVLEEYADKMPFRFKGTLNKFVVVLDPHKLSEEEQKRLHDALAKAMMAVQWPSDWETKEGGATSQTHRSSTNLSEAAFINRL
jgi:hypothetical protein